MREIRKQIARLALLLVASIAVWAQQAQPVPAGNPQQQGGFLNPNPQNPPSQGAPQPIQQLPPDTIRPNYVLGPNDQVLIRAPEAEELDNRPFRIDGDGNMNLPLFAHFRVAESPLQELEAGRVRRLREFIREPQVFVQISQYRSEP